MVVDDTEIKRLKQKIHILVASAYSRGIIKKGLCEECGSKSVHAHHDDYSKLFVVRWLCCKHHTIWHVNNKAKTPSVSVLEKIISDKRIELKSMVGVKRGNKVSVAVSFHDDQYKFIAKVAKEKKISFSQAAREVFQFGIDAVKKLHKKG